MADGLAPGFIAPVRGDLLLIAVLLGTACQLTQQRLWSPPAYPGLLAVGAALLVIGVLVSRRSLRHPFMESLSVFMLALCLALVAFAMTGWRATSRAQGALPPGLEGQDLWVTGAIATMPQLTEFGFRLEFEVDSLTDVAGAVPPAAAAFLPARVSLSWPATMAGAMQDPARTTPVPIAGDRWRILVRLRAPHGTANPHAPDPELWFWSHGIRATGSARINAVAPARALGRDPAYAMERARQGLRDAIFARVRDPARAGVLAALAVGDQQAIDRSSWDVFRTTGVAHLMSISGLHVTMFAWGAAWAVGWAWRGSRRLCLACPAPVAAALAGVMGAALYAAFSGGGLPAQRTVGMLAVALGLRAAGVRWPWPRVWLVTAAALALSDPWALLQGGFWLSFVAVGVLFASDRSAFDAVPGGARGRLRALLREQATVTLALAPLTLVLFGQVSLVGLIANLIAIPWVTLVVTPLALGGVAAPALWDGGAFAVGLMAWVLEAMAAWPLAQWEAAAAPAWLALPALAGGLLLVLPMPPALRALGLPLLLPLALWQPPAVAPGQVEVLAADIGQGNAVLVRTARHVLLYDTGPRWGLDSDAGHRVLVPLMRSLGLEPDEVVVSHRDADHIRGAASVLARHPRAGLLTSIEPGHPLAAIRAPRLCLAGQRWTWDGVVFEVLYPDENDHERWASQPNGLSCVLRITAAGGAILLAGDLEAAQERLLLARLPGDRLHADVLLVPHHGSKTSSTPEFIDAVAPGIALVQAGYRNRFGHPAAPVMARYEERGIQVVESPACGAARWQSQVPGRVQCEREAGRRYWHHRASRLQD